MKYWVLVFCHIQVDKGRRQQKPIEKQKKISNKMTMTMTLREVQLTDVSVGVMTPRIKESVALMRLAILARCALTHG